jgi:ribonuclease III
MKRGREESLESRLGYRFIRPILLERALTHSSAVPELRAASGTGEEENLEIQANERLEFLGDAVLDLLASEYLVEKFPDWSEGRLSKSRARMVNEQALEEGARRLGIGDFLVLGKGEEKTGGREKPAILADALEAIVGAIYLDGGLGGAREVLRHSLFKQALEERGDHLADPDHKSALQEFLQRRGFPPAEYRLAGQSGPDHARLFLVEVWSQGESLASGEATTKKEAEQIAAGGALLRLKQAEAQSFDR